MQTLSITLASLFVAACGSTVDAGDREYWSERIEPARADSAQTLYDGNARVAAYAVDETTIYALLYRDETSAVGGDGELVMRLVSCPFEACAPNLTVLAEVRSDPNWAPDPSTLLLSDGELLWTQVQENEAGRALMSCSSSGCPEGPRELGGQLVRMMDPSAEEISGALAADEHHIYWQHEHSLMRCSRPDCPSSELVFEDAPDAPPWNRFVLHEEHAYLGGESAIFRIRKDGLGTIEPIVDGVFALRALSVDAGGVYFATSLLTGAILRCDLEGCAGGPERLVEGQRWPLAVEPDAVNLYWAGSEVAAGAADRGTLTRCPKAGCEQAEVLATNLSLSDDFGPLFAMNEQYLFWSENVYTYRRYALAGEPGAGLSTTVRGLLRLVKK